MLRLHAIPFSTNVERVELAARLKNVELELVTHPAEDRSAIEALSSQSLVPVLEHDDGSTLTDSMAIVTWLEEHHPEPALWPADPAHAREVQAFVDWFNFVWKVPPNAIDGHRRSGAPDDARVAAWSAQLRAYQHGFEALLHGRDFLFGDAITAADVCAFPFLRFTTSADPDDDDLFHGVLLEHLPGDFPRLSAWIDRTSTF